MTTLDPRPLPRAQGLCPEPPLSNSGGPAGGASGYSRFSRWRVHGWVTRGWPGLRLTPSQGVVVLAVLVKLVVLVMLLALVILVVVGVESVVPVVVSCREYDPPCFTCNVFVVSKACSAGKQNDVLANRTALTRIWHVTNALFDKMQCFCGPRFKLLAVCVRIYLNKQSFEVL